MYGVPCAKTRWCGTSPLLPARHPLPDGHTRSPSRPKTGAPLCCLSPVHDGLTCLFLAQTIFIRWVEWPVGLRHAPRPGTCLFSYPPGREIIGCTHTPLLQTCRHLEAEWQLYFNTVVNNTYTHPPFPIVLLATRACGDQNASQFQLCGVRRGVWQ
jgi:hypothetical protein